MGLAIVIASGSCIYARKVVALRGDSPEILKLCMFAQLGFAKLVSHMHPFFLQTSI